MFHQYLLSYVFFIFLSCIFKQIIDSDSGFTLCTCDSHSTLRIPHSNTCRLVWAKHYVYRLGVIWCLVVMALTSELDGLCVDDDVGQFLSYLNFLLLVRFGRHFQVHHLLVKMPVQFTTRGAARPTQSSDSLITKNFG